MKKFLMVFGLCAALMSVGCASLKPGCILKDKASALATDVIVSNLQCENVFAVKADMDELFGEDLGLCKTGPIANALCPMLSKAVVDFVASNGIPRAWSCTAANLKGKLGDFLTDNCRKLPVVERK